MLALLRQALAKGRTPDEVEHADVDAVETEIEAVHHDARRQVDEAQAAVFAAQHAAQQATADQSQQRAEADAAAEEALARAEAAEEARSAAERAAEAARAEQAEAVRQAAADITEAREQAAAQVAQAQADAQQQVAAAQESARAEVTDARAAAEEQIRRVMGESEAQVTEAQRDARTAETARAAAEQRAADGHAAVEQLREELAGARAQHRTELEQLRADTAARLEELLTTAYRTRDEPEADPPPTSSRTRVRKLLKRITASMRNSSTRTPISHRPRLLTGVGQARRCAEGCGPVVVVAREGWRGHHLRPNGPALHHSRTHIMILERPWSVSQNVSPIRISRARIPTYPPLHLVTRIVGQLVP